MSRHCLDIDWDIRHWNIFLNIFWIYLKKDEKKEEKSGSAGDRTHGGGRVPLCCLTLYRLRHRTYTFEKSKNTSYKLCTQCCMLHSMSFVVLFVECWMLYINVATYVETLDSLVHTPLVKKLLSSFKKIYFSKKTSQDSFIFDFIL